MWLLYFFFRESNPVLKVENIAFKQFNFLRYQDIFFFFLLVMQPLAGKAEKLGVD